MKKIILTSLILMLIITGCFKDKVIDIEEVLINMKGLQSYHMSINYDIKYTLDDDVNIKTNIESDIDYNSNLVVNLVKYEGLDVKNIETSYIKLDENIIYEKRDGWYYSNGSINIPFKGFDISLSSTSDKYEMILSYEEVNNIMQLCRGLENYKIRYEEVEAFLNVKDKYINDISINIPLDTLIDDKAVFAIVSVNIEFSNFNLVSSIIPGDVVNSARNIKVLEINNTVKSYLEQINIEQFKLDGIDKIDLTDFKYNDFIFDKIDLSVSSTISGFIEYDGYKISIIENKITEIVKK